MIAGRRTLAAGLLLGAIADAVFGDPVRYHPVAGFGTLAGRLERAVYADDRRHGAGYALACVAGSAALGWAAQRATRRRPVAHTLAVAVGTWAVLGGTGLVRAGEALHDRLAAGDLPGARAELPRLCARDPAGLDAAGLARAGVESVAENTGDAVVAPLLCGAVAGLPGLLAYRAINTLDAMVGYRTPRYLRFGWAAARLDDVANWLPARCTGVLAAGCAVVVGGSPGDALRTVRRYGGRHPSPNAGRCEAAFAGALGVRLGGVNVYFGEREDRPVLGDGRTVTPADLARAARLSRAVGVAAALLAIAVALVPGAAAPAVRSAA